MKKYTFSLSFIIVLCFCSSSSGASQKFSQASIAALGNAYIRANPILAYYYGSLEEYVEENREHFVAGGEAIRCAQALSQALMQGAIQSYDQNALRRRDELNARLGAMGISSGPQEATASQQLYAMAMQLDRLAYALPFAANGNFQPLYTPRNETEEMQIFAAQMLQVLLQDPSTAQIFNQMAPMIRELAEMEYQILVNMASNLRMP